MDIKHPHDSFFREFFSYKENLLPLLSCALPPEVVSLFDVDSIEIDKGTWIDEDHKEHCSDQSAIKTSFGELFPLKLLKVLEHYLPNFTVALFDINTNAMTQETLPLVPQVDAALWSFKYAPTQMEELLKALDNKSLSQEYLPKGGHYEYRSDVDQ